MCIPCSLPPLQNMSTCPSAVHVDHNLIAEFLQNSQNPQHLSFDIVALAPKILFITTSLCCFMEGNPSLPLGTTAAAASATINSCIPPEQMSARSMCSSHLTLFAGGLCMLIARITWQSTVLVTFGVHMLPFCKSSGLRIDRLGFLTWNVLASMNASAAYGSEHVMSWRLQLIAK